MIQVIVKKEQDAITLLKVSGHALFDDYGKDIVCAGVSSIMVGLLNALDIKTNYQTVVDDEKQVMFASTSKISEAGQMILEVGLIQLQTIANQFPNYITIQEVK